MVIFGVCALSIFRGSFLAMKQDENIIQLDQMFGQVSSVRKAWAMDGLI